MSKDIFKLNKANEFVKTNFCLFKLRSSCFKIEKNNYSNLINVGPEPNILRFLGRRGHNDHPGSWADLCWSWIWRSTRRSTFRRSSLSSKTVYSCENEFLSNLTFQNCDNEVSLHNYKQHYYNRICRLNYKIELILNLESKEGIYKIR